MERGPDLCRLMRPEIYEAACNQVNGAVKVLATLPSG